MAEMTTKEIVDYLKQVSALETSVYKQTEVKKEIKSQLTEPVLENIKKPQRTTVSQPCKPDVVDVTSSASIGGVVCGIVAVILFFVFLFKEDVSTVIGIVLGCIFLFIGAMLFLPGFINSKRAYTERLESYQDACAENQKKYELALQNYEKDTKRAEEKFDAAQTAYNTAVCEVAKLDAPIEETQTLLERLYSADIIFPKYRNMVAMCTMYEYFASGRCTELTGPTGAYNLYEAELRQNLIINQLEQVNDNLEQVKQNQYMLYQGIAETNQALQSISGSLYDIALSSRITAYCSQITAVNAQAQTYIALLN